MFKKPNEPTRLDKAIDSLLDKMEKHEPYSDEYAKMVEQLEKLYKTKNLKKDKEPFVSSEVLVPVLGNIAGIIAVIHHEQVGVITTKALGFIIKPRI